MAVCVEGLVFIVLSLTNVREAIFNSIPMTLKSAVSVGIGLFIAFIGLQNAKIVVNSDATLLTYQTFKGDTFNSIGIGAILALIGVLVTAIPVSYTHLDVYKRQVSARGPISWNIYGTTGFTWMIMR